MPRIALGSDEAGPRICVSCAEPINGRYNEYGPVTKYGECYNCGLKAMTADQLRNDPETAKGVVRILRHLAAGKSL